MKKTSIIAIVVVVLLAVGGYLFFRKSSTVNAPSGLYQSPSGSSQSSVKPSPSSPMPATNNFAPANAEMALKTATDPNLGTFLVASNGMTLYMYTKDTPAASNCYGQCAVNWPPYTVSAAGSIKADPSVRGTIATTTRTDGTLQVTYNGTPLYYWINDKKPGDTTGQNVGGVWFVVKP